MASPSTAGHLPRRRLRRSPVPCHSLSSAEVPTGPMRSPTCAITPEEIGVLVMAIGLVGSNNYRKLDYGEFQPMVALDRHLGVGAFVVDGSDTRAAQIFSLAHELAHIWPARELDYRMAGSGHSDYAPPGSLVQSGSCGDARPDAPNPF